MHSPCQFDSIKKDMKWKKLLVFSGLILVFACTVTAVAAATVRPDIRTALIRVKRRPMPTIPPGLEWWIKCYVGVNKIPDFKIKFYEDLESDSNQLYRATKRLTQHIVWNNTTLPTEEEGNKPSWNGQICYYGAASGNIPSNKLIVSEGTIPDSTRKMRISELLAAEIARARVPLSGSTYNLKKENVEPDTGNPLPCGDTPPGKEQGDLKKQNTGENRFLFDFCSDPMLDAICAVCQCCIDIDMWIKPDSTNQYASYAAANLAGAIDSQGNVQQAIQSVDPKHRADENAIGSGGVGNVFRPSLMQILFEFIEKIIGHSVGIVDKQSTENNQGLRIVPASWSFTKEWEVAWDFINCKLFNFVFRPDMPECNRNWLETFIQNVTNQLEGTGQQPAGPASQQYGESL